MKGKGGNNIIDGTCAKLKYCWNYMEVLTNFRCLWTAYGNLKEKRNYSNLSYGRALRINFSELSVNETLYADIKFWDSTSWEKKKADPSF